MSPSPTSDSTIGPRRLNTPLFAAFNAAQKQSIRLAYRKLVITQSSDDPCSAVESGAPEALVWKRERCRCLVFPLHSEPTIVFCRQNAATGGLRNWMANQIVKTLGF